MAPTRRPEGRTLAVAAARSGRAGDAASERVDERAVDDQGQERRLHLAGARVGRTDGGSRSAAADRAVALDFRAGAELVLPSARY